jgi:protein-disulfide isomerase
MRFAASPSRHLFPSCLGSNEMASRVEQRRLAREERVTREREKRERNIRQRRLLELAGLVLAALVAVAVLIAVSSGGTAPKRATPPHSFAGIPAAGATLGEPGAPVTIVEFADLQCPFCAQFDRTVLPTLVDRYVRSGQVRLEFRPLRFLGDDSVRAAAMAGAAARQHRLWPFVDAFYRRQGKENSGYVTDDFLREVLRSVPGMDVAKAMADAASARTEELPAKAEAEADAAGIDSVPSFLMGPTGGKLSELSVPSLEAEEFTAQIDAALGARR